MCSSKMTRPLLPRFKIHNIHSAFGTGENLMEFWVYCSENNIKSLSLDFFKSLLKNSQFDAKDFRKFWNKLQDLENNTHFIKSKLPKYIMSLPIARPVYWSVPGEFDKETKILPFLDNIFSNDEVKVVVATPTIVMIDVWLKDDADLATLEFYQISNPELFYHCE